MRNAALESRNAEVGDPSSLGFAATRRKPEVGELGRAERVPGSLLTPK